MSKRPPFVKVAEVADIPEGVVKHIIVHDKPMALCRVEGNFHAVNAVCPHMGGPLASGKLSGCVIACPWHGWTFDVRTGESPIDPEMKVRCYPVQVESGDIILEIP